MSKPEHSPLPTCVITGRIAGDGFACGDCDPCIRGAFGVPPEVKDLLSERDEFAGKYEDEAVRHDACRAAIAELVEALKPFADAADGRKRKDLLGAVCFKQEHLLKARALIAKHKAGE